MKTFRRKPRSDSPEAAPDVIEVSSGTSLSEPLGTKRDGGGGHDSDDNSPPEKLWLGVSSGQPKEKNSKGSGATKLRKKRKKKAKQEADPTQKQLHFPVQTSKGDALVAAEADGSHESAAAPLASRDPPGNAPSEAAAGKPLPKKSPYFSGVAKPAKAKAGALPASVASSDGGEIEVCFGTEDTPTGTKDGNSTIAEGSQDPLSAQSPTRRHTKPDLGASTKAAAEGLEPLPPYWFDCSKPSAEPSSPEQISGTLQKQKQPEGSTSLQTGSPLACDEPMALPETPVASTWDLPSQTPEPAAPATGTFKQQLLSNAEKRREQKQKGAAAESSPLLLSPSPTAGQKKRGRAKKGGAKRRRSATQDSAESRSPSLSRFASVEKPGSDSPQNPNMRVALWEPPVSPYCLIEEALYNDPWRLLVACMLLNKTTGRAVRKILWKLFELAPTPESGATVDTAQVEEIIKPLGLFRKRALMFKRFSQEYLETNWTDPQQLHGIGRYAADAYYIFCRNQWRERDPPQDKDLLKYYEWLLQTDGQGSGHEREVFTAPASESASISTG